MKAPKLTRGRVAETNRWQRWRTVTGRRRQMAAPGTTPESETGGDNGPWAGGEANLVSDEPVYKFEATPMTSDVSSLLRRHSVIGVASNLEVQCCCIDWLKFASPPVSLSCCQRCSSWPCGFFLMAPPCTTTRCVVINM